jgi:phosphatidate cytidylyltransferase
MSNLTTRVLTAIVFGAVLIACIFGSPYSLVVLCLVVCTVTAFEFNILLAQHKGSSLDPYFQSILVAVFFLISIFSFWDVIDANDAYVIFPIMMVNITFVLFNRNAKPLLDIGSISIQLFYFAVPMLMLCLTAFPSGFDTDFQPWKVMSFFIIIWASDTGAYFVGKYLGKRKLFERISPKKTIEGFFGGLVFSSVAGYLLAYYTGVFNPQKGIFLGIVLAFMGTMGDLVESMIKRELGVKDSGTLLPGHGGMLDRFDSTFFAAPFYFFIVMFR